MKNLLYFALFAFVFTACQKDETASLIQQKTLDSNFELPSDINLNIDAVKHFKAAIILETEKGTESFNEISLEGHPEAWFANPEGKVVPNMEVIEKLLDYTKISKHNEKTVLKQSLAVYPPSSEEFNDDEPRYSCFKASYRARKTVCSTNQHIKYDCGFIYPVRVCKDALNTCVVYDTRTNSFIASSCNSL